MADQRRLIHFSGTVQGVGFRYTTMRLAGGFEVTGYVRNLPDGRVEVLAEGNRDEIDSFVNAIGLRMEGYVRQADQQTLDGAAQFTRFEISF